jgi:hypothetical protein
VAAEHHEPADDEGEGNHATNDPTGVARLVADVQIPAIDIRIVLVVSHVNLQVISIESLTRRSSHRSRLNRADFGGGLRCQESVQLVFALNWFRFRAALASPRSPDTGEDG